MTAIALLSDDLLFASQLTAPNPPGSGGGCRIQLITRPAELPTWVESANCPLVAIDLNCPGLEIGPLIEQLQAVRPDVQLVAYGPHVQTARLEAARQAGCEVYTRGQFHQQWREILRL